MLTESQVRDIIVDCKIKVRYKDLDIFRELAKRPEIRLLWSMSKSASAPFFDKPTTEWNVLQVRLVYWLTVYDNVESSPERPPARVIWNNSLMDSWLEAKSKEAEGQFEANWAKGSNKVAKSAYDHDEVWQLGGFDDEADYSGYRGWEEG